jgi:transcriptional regulator with XRE-family HTH domain
VAKAPLHPASTTSGVDDLDAAIEGLYWGDNVVWEVDAHEDAEPFVAAIAADAGRYDAAAYITFGTDPAAAARRYRGFDVLDARPGYELGKPGALVTAIRRWCSPARRDLLVFDPLDLAADAWGAATAARFFVRTCPMLLDMAAIAYWTVGMRERFAGLRREIEDVTQCVLVLRDGRLRIAKAEGRSAGVQGSVFHVRAANGAVTLERAPAAARLGAALRALRDERRMTQADLAAAAGVSASAISQAERGLRGLSLETLLDLTARLGMTVDELLRGRVAPGYRLGRRGDPRTAGPSRRAAPLLDDPHAGMRAYVVRIAPGGTVQPALAHKGVELVLVADGLVQVVLSSGRPVLRSGEALLVDRGTIAEWRNLGDRRATAFWVIRDERR